MTHLDRFFELATEAGWRFRSEFAAECVPILRGEVVRPLDGLLSGPR
jgi:hypothetical protein